MMVPEWIHAEELCHCDDRRCRSRSIGKTKSIRRRVYSVRVNDGSTDPNERLFEGTFDVFICCIVPFAERPPR